MSINRVNISGNLTRDPELRSMPSGTQVLSFSVAVNDRVRDQQSGEWKDRPNYVDCVLFGARAQGLSRFLTKGTKVAVEGKLHYSKWQAQDGSNRSKLEVYVDEVEFMSSRNQGAQPGYPQGGQPYQQPYQQQPSYQQPQGYQQQPQPAQTFGSGNGGFAAIFRSRRYRPWLSPGSVRGARKSVLCTASIASSARKTSSSSTTRTPSCSASS